MAANGICGDLHNHTKASDGECTPSQLVDWACELGLKALGVTDHDTIDGLQEATKHAAEKGLTLVPGVEVSLRFRRDYFVGTLHYLLYIPYRLLADPEFCNDAEKTFSLARGAALNKARVDLINKLFGPTSATPVLKTPFTVEEVEKLAPNVTRRHFMLALKARGLDTPDINKLISNDSAAYVPSGMEPSDLKPFLKKYPSLVRVFAHPAAGSFPGESHYKEVLPPVETVERLLPEFLDEAWLGLDGFEVHYPGHTTEHEALVMRWAAEHNKIVTGGSDCHDRTARQLGKRGASEAETNVLLERLRK
eukprot:TRINITY_DN17939_c0_g1_i1.p1 TRINITY_DN17939_c0_g1~~TRINITY_DN17939_c0_g1_i1.p1  ORF type:complete len:321 (+),score=109.34 TRINITY_DN17939_c0_g1_i1:43-963(+)